jgi:hypothetical protein
VRTSDLEASTNAFSRGQLAKPYSRARAVCAALSVKRGDTEETAENAARSPARADF